MPICSIPRPGVLRTEAEFKQAFSKARITKTTLARYYLRALELHKQGDANADLGGAPDESFAFNVKHIMLQRESDDWPIDEPVAQQVRKRLVNLVLLSPDENVKLGGKGFADKKKVYVKSPLLLTQSVGAFASWGPAEIDQWREQLSELAVKLWPEK